MKNRMLILLSCTTMLSLQGMKRTNPFNPEPLELTVTKRVKIENQQHVEPEKIGSFVNHALKLRDSKVGININSVCPNILDSAEADFLKTIENLRIKLLSRESTGYSITLNIPKKIRLHRNVDVIIEFSPDIGNGCPGAPCTRECALSPFVVLMDYKFFNILRAVMAHPDYKKQNIVNALINGLTPLMIAAKGANRDALKVLLDLGADRYCLNNSKNRAIDLTQDQEVKKILKRYNKNYFEKSDLKKQLSDKFIDLYIN